MKEIATIWVDKQPDKPFSIRNKNGGWLCANTADRSKWHYASNPRCTGVTEYETFEEAEAVCKSIKNHEIVEFKE